MTLEEVQTLKEGDRVVTVRGTIVIIRSKIKMIRNNYCKIKIEMPSSKKNWCDNITGYLLRKATEKDLEN